LAEGLHDWGMRAVPLFSYTLAFALQLRKSTENLSQGSRLAELQKDRGLYRCRVTRWSVVVGDDRLGTGQWQWVGGGRRREREVYRQGM
jgi:hypothetical protein